MNHIFTYLIFVRLCLDAYMREWKGVYMWKRGLDIVNDNVEVSEWKGLCI